jgi:hypothetical protein
MTAAAPEMALLLLLLFGGSAGSDLVSMLDPGVYFQARQIDLSLDKMASLAGATPEDGKAQVMQLVALRYLAEHSDTLQRDAQYAAHR